MRHCSIRAVVLALPALVLVFALAFTAHGQPEVAGRTWNVDPVHSSVVFRIKHMETAYFYGTFNEISGSITTGDAPSFQFTIPVKSIDTRHPTRDEHVLGNLMFEADQFPDLTFQSTAVTVEGDTYRVTGDLTMHGVTRPIEVTIEKTGQASDPRMGDLIGFETVFKVKRSDFGMTQMVGPLSDEITLMVGLEAVGQ